MRPLHKAAFHLFFLVLVAGGLAVAQNPTARRLIVEKVDENQLVALKGNTPPAANAKNDLGRVNSGMPMTDLVLVLRRSPEMQAAFDAFVESQYEENSPNYHQWLTPEQVGEKFGPALSDIATVSAWLTSHGLSVDEVSKDRMSIRFSGTAGRVEAAFHTELHNLTAKGAPHFSNMTDPQIPFALEPVVLGPKGLNNFVPRPLHRLGGKVSLDQATGQWKRVGAPSPALGRVQPEIGFSCGTSCQIEDMTPYDFATIYNVAPLWTSGIDGTGQTIAIVGTSDVRSSDVTAFRTAFGLSGGSFNTIHNGPDPGYCTTTSSTALCTINDQIENGLDVEWSGSTAPKAAITLVVTQQTSTNDAVYESAKYIVQNNTAKIINVSYGNCELYEGTSGNAAYNTLWQTAATAGIAVFVASGDAGSPACDQGGDASGTPYAAQYGLAVSGLASSPYVTAVGGTDLNWGNTAAPYWNTTNSTNGATAKNYVPEVTWNDSCTNPLVLSYLQGAATFLQNNGFGASSPTDAESACNFVFNWWSTIQSLSGVNLSSLVDTVGGGGGASNCTTNSTTNTTVGTCSAGSGYSKPSWQTGVTGIPNDGKRDIPDISFFAGNGFLGSAYLICVSDWATSSGTTCVSKPYPTTEPAAGEIGGTSAGTPAMAGIMALINQKAGKTQGNPNSALYSLAAKQNYSSCAAESVTNSSSCYFNDIDKNTISMPCIAGSLNCTVKYSGDAVGVLSGFDAGVGFDNATGLGSLNVANVVNGWTSSIGTAAATVTVTPTPASIAANQSLSVAVTVAGSSGTPTGTVTLSGGGYTSSAQTLASGSTTFTVPANSLSTGSITLTANYNGDPTYATATGSSTVTVTAPPKPTVAVTANPASINNLQGTAVTVVVSGTNGTPTGTVVLTSGTFTSASKALDNTGTVVFNLSPGVLAVGTDTITATYSGDTVYGSNTGTTQVTVAKAAFTLAASTPAAISAGGTATSNITVTGSNGYAGTVTLSCALTSSPSGAVEVPICAPTSGQSTIAISSGTPTGTGQVTVGTTAAPAVALKLASRQNGSGWFRAAGGVGLASLVLFFLPVSSKRYRNILCTILVLVAGSFIAVGCGGGGSTPQKTTPIVTVTPAKSSITETDSLQVAVMVSGSTGSGTSVAPTGSVTLTSGSYTSSVTSLAGGSATITIPAGKLTVGTSNTLSVSYGGDSNYNPASGTASVTVTKSATTSGTYTFTVTGTGNDSAATTATTTFTLTVN